MTAKTLIIRFSAVVCILLILFAGQARGQQTTLKWFGHAAFSVTTPRGRVLLIDSRLAFQGNRPAQVNPK